MFKAAVDGPGGSVAGAGSVEVGQDVGGTLLEGPAQSADFGERSGDAAGEGFDDLGHLLPTAGPVGFAVGGDHALVDPPGRLDLHVLITPEQRAAPRGLPVGEQVEAGVQRPPGAYSGSPERPR